MQLITLLLIIVAILTLLSGVAVFSGAHKGEKGQAFLFLFTTIAALGWAIGVGTFLSLAEDTPAETTRAIIATTYISAPIMCWGLMAYTCHKYMIGKVGMVVLGAICAVFVWLILTNPSLLYSGWSLDRISGNTVYIRQDAFYVVYGIYHFIAVILYMLGLWYAARKAKSTRIKKANLVVLAGFTVTGALALVFDFLLPYFGKYDTIWVGVLAMSVAWILYYYAILRYRLLDLSSRWLKGFSRFIVMSLAAIVYLVIFFSIFVALFKTATPSTEVILLNVLMIVAVLLLFPALNELSAFVGSLAAMDEVDVAYIVKRLTALVGDNVDLTELSAFLSDHLHFQYIGFVMNDKVRGVKQLRITQETVTEIAKLRKSSAGIWLEPGTGLAETLKKLDIVAVAEMRDGKGKVIGQILFGRPNGRISFESRDLVPIEIVIQALPMVIESDKYRIKKHLI